MQLLLQLSSMFGAGLILGAYVALQRRWWFSTTPAFLWCNLVGALILTGVALIDRRVGFVVLEATWAAVSLHTMLRRPTARG